MFSMGPYVFCAAEYVRRYFVRSGQVRARCAFGLELDIFGNELGAVPDKNLMNRSPISPNGPIAMGINA